MMKKTIAMLLCLMMAFTAVSCSKGGTSSQTGNVSSSPLIPEEGWNEIPTESGDDLVSSDLQSVDSTSASSESTASNAPVTSQKPGSSSKETASKTTSSKKEDVKPVAGTLNAVYKPEFAKGFTIEYYHGGAKIISTNFQAATDKGEAYDRKQRILLMPDGATLPKNTKWDERIDGKVERVVTLASSHAGHFANLNAIDVVKGTSIKASGCSIPSLKKALEDGKTITVTKTQDSKYFDQELVASLKPQVIFVGGMQSDVTAAEKLEESGLTCVYIGDFAEESYMGRAQWIELFGSLIEIGRAHV